MARFERVCPECGTSNTYDKAQCVKCRAPLTGARAPQELPAPVLTRKAMAKLAWRVTKFMTVMGVSLAWRGAARGVEKIRESHSGNVKNETIEGDYSVPSADPPAAPPGKFPPAREWGTLSGDTDDNSTESKTSLHWGPKPNQKTG